MPPHQNILRATGLAYYTITSFGASREGNMPSVLTCYYLMPTGHAPNSPLPVLHYQSVLPEPITEEVATQFLTSHQWEKRVRLQGSILNLHIAMIDICICRLTILPREHGVQSRSAIFILIVMNAMVGTSSGALELTLHPRPWYLLLTVSNQGFSKAHRPCT